MMKISKFIYILFLSAIAIAMSACVPKATEKKAVCGANQAFNSVSRSCVVSNVVAPRAKPVGTTNSNTLSEEVAKTITLSYTDGNSDQAVSCAISGVTANIEAVSPHVINGNIFNKADLVFYAAQDAVNALPLGADKTAALIEVTAMQTMLDNARATFNYSNLLNQLGLFNTAVNNILAITSSYTSLTAVNYYYNLTQSRFVGYSAVKTFVDNRCDCTGGICTTTIAPRIHQTGAAGFNYTISDIDGEGNSKSVSLSIAAMSGSTNYLKPTVESVYASGTESNTQIPSTYAFTLGTARDYIGTSSFTYSHGKTVQSTYFSSLSATKTYVDSDSALGKITNCLGLGGSLTSDTVCLYIPNNGDAFSTLAPAKALVVLSTDLTITAKSKGVAGNNISIVFKDITTDLTALDGAHSTQSEKFGLVGSLNDIYIRVIDNTIYVVFSDNISTTLEIANAINADMAAKSLVDASAAGLLTPATVASASAGVSLAGGIGGYDTFSYTASNAATTSTNTATATIQIDSALDNPVWNPYPSTSSPLVAIDGTATSLLEGSTALSMPINVSSTYYDPDNVATTCAVSTDSLDLIIWASGSNGLSGVTAVEVLKSSTDFAQVMPIPTCAITGVAPNKIITFSVDRGDATKTNANGTYALLFKITNGAALTTSAPTFHAYRFTVTPINDRPDASAISWTTSSTTPTTSASGATWAMTTRENSTASPSVAYADITINPDVTATGFETAQTLTLTAVSSNQTILKDASITITSISATVKRVSFTTEKDQSGTANINLTLTDNGGTTNTGVDTHNPVIALTVSMVDDPPYLFSTFATVDTNEGGLVQSPGFLLEEDSGKSPDENVQNLYITNISSDNTTVLLANAVTIFYDLNDNGVEDTGEARAVSAVVPLEDITDPSYPDVDGGLHKFYLKLKPVAGVSGNANVTLTVSDGTNAVNMQFALIVHPVAALHGGWANISAVGIKTDKNKAPVSTSDIQCNYNTSSDTNKCDTNQSCTGTSAPHGSITPSASNVLFWDSASQKCYRSQSTSKFSWVDVTTSCPVTRIFVSPTTLSTAITSGSTSMTVASTTGFPAAGVITIGTEQISYTGKTATTFTGLTRAVNLTTAAAHSASDAIAYTANGENFIKDLTATPVKDTPVATAKNQYYLDTGTTPDSCYASKEISSGVWGWNASVFIPSKVTLSWNAFTVTGSGPDSSVQTYGWNVYRREKGEDYDFVSGYLKIGETTMTISDATVRTFTDTTAVAGKVYYYLVRPVDSTTRHLTISTADVFSEVRILAPTENYAFVHRWMVNQEVCNSMHMTTATTNKVDQTNNYRCPYNGPGESIATPGYYDIEKDMLVDISESGCPYTAAPSCSAWGCIGIGDPTSAPDNADDVYYNRSSGTCHIYQGGTWKNYSIAALTATITDKTNSALNAPLTNVTKTIAESVCNTRTVGATLAAALTGATPVVSTATLSLPTKKEYIAYSASPYSMTDTLVTAMEQGFSLNIQSRCNSSNANGIDTAFTDSSIPSTSFIYSLPGTASSGIRSLYTGSVPWGNNYSTETCSSRYGIQDVYGNVAEWMKDNVTCDGSVSTYVCKANAETDLGIYDFDTAGAGVTKYGFDYVTGPYNDASGDSIPGAGDGFLTNWDFRDELFGAGKFSFPVGMPINVDIASANANQLSASAALLFLLDIGPTAGITSSQLHQDGIIVNGANVNADASQKGYFAQGGSYLSGNFSGRYSSELIPSATVRPDVGFRCYLPIIPANFPTDSRHTYSY